MEWSLGLVFGGVGGGGARVYHQTFGYGKITAAEENCMEVNFDKYGRKKIMSSYLEKVD